MNEVPTLNQQPVGRVDRPIQLRASFRPQLVEVDPLVRASAARTDFRCNGDGVTVAVLDTGLNTTHVDFSGRISAQRNYTGDNEGSQSDATDGNGHGTNVAGIVAANGIHVGIAPGCNVLPMKVLPNRGHGSFKAVFRALRWLLENRTEYGVSAVCMSLGDQGNYQSDSQFDSDGIRACISELDHAGVVCCIAAGNDFFLHESRQGMSYPAIVRDSISVGAVYDSLEGRFDYESGATAFTSIADQITPFSQRLHSDQGGDCATDIFAPGAPTTSTGIGSDYADSIQHGTSQATPVVTGVVLLLQSYWLRVCGELPTAEAVREWLLSSAVRIVDGDDEDDNVVNTGKEFARVDAYGALTACSRAASTPAS